VAVVLIPVAIVFVLIILVGAALAALFLVITHGGSTIPTIPTP
jgi:hypothetical protein